MLVQVFAPDGGELYTETNLNNTFPEPLNAATSLLFVALAVFWLVRLKYFNHQHLFLSFASWVLLIGSIGGTVYHGLRLSAIFIWMDWLPIAILCVLGSVYFWNLAAKNWYLGWILVALLVGTEYIILNSTQSKHPDFAQNLNYGIMGAMLLFPLGIVLARNHWREWRLILLAFSTFGIALFFRVADSWKIISTGTHFLWHIFGAIATLSLFLFIYREK